MIFKKKVNTNFTPQPTWPWSSELCSRRRQREVLPQQGSDSNEADDNDNDEDDDEDDEVHIDNKLLG